HHVARPGVVVPALIRLDIHRAELPLPQRIVDPRLKASLLLRLADLEPQLDQDDAPVDDVPLHSRAELEEALMIPLGAEAHHIFNAGTIVPAPVEDDDFSCRREMLDIALHEDLRLLPVGRRRQRDDAKHARADAPGDRLDGAALAGGIAPLEDDDDAQAL